MTVAGVVLDLDDTLYHESDYVRSGFAAVARAIARSDGDEEMFFDFLWLGFQTGHRGDAFDRLRKRWPTVADEWTVAALVEAYRRHPPTISLSEPDAVERLLALDLGHGIITDGPVASQLAKVRALGLEDRLDPIVVTDRWGQDFRKPHQRAFIEIERRWGSSGHELVYVGDNPSKDFIAPRMRGWITVRVRNDRQLHRDLESLSPQAAPDYEVGSLAEFLDRV